MTLDTDPKLARLADELAAIASEANRDAIGEQQERDFRKIIIFTYYADTAKCVSGYLSQAAQEREDLAPYRGRIAMEPDASRPAPRTH